MVNASASPRFTTVVKILPCNFTCSSNLLPKSASRKPQALWSTVGAINGSKNGVVHLAVERNDELINVDEFDVQEDSNDKLGLEIETLLYSFHHFPVLVLAALLPGAATVRSLFGPFVELVKLWNLPDWLVRWGHPANMVVVLFAMGGYGTYLGFRMRSPDDLVKAKNLHPKLMVGMFFFALGATGGVTSLLTLDRPIFERPHVVTGFIGLAILTIQTILLALFELLMGLFKLLQGNPRLRNVHGILGSGIMMLFFSHAALGLQLGFSY